jgi:hypothetical protein
VSHLSHFDAAQEGSKMLKYFQLNWPMDIGLYVLRGRTGQPKKIAEKAIF